MKKHPPKFAMKFLRWFCREDYIEEIEGDLVELFGKQCEQAPSLANQRFFWQVLRHFRPAFIKPFTNPFFHPGMFRHNLLITYRSHLHNKTSFLINLIGMSTGLLCVLLIFLWVNDEMNVDKFNEKDKQLYQVMQHFQPADEIMTWEYTPYILSESLTKELPEIQAATTTNNRYYRPTGLLSDGEKHIATEGLFARENFFQIFSYNLLKGEKGQVLADKKSIVISEDIAFKLFRSKEEAIGKTLLWSTNLIEESFQVSGIFENPPANATRQFDVVVLYDWLIKADEHANSWNGDYAETFLVLKEGISINEFNKKIVDHYNGKAEHKGAFSLFVQKYSDRYLYGNYKDGKIVGGRIEYVKLFSIIAFLILLIACINFMNLSTAQASKKMKEIGVKKAIGATRKALVFQFLNASVLLVFLSLLVALASVSFILPYFNEITAKALYLNFNRSILLSILGIVIFVGLVAGSYPALYLSKFNPVKVLKGIRSTSTGETWVRKGLVIFQFTLSVIFIVGVLVINEQMKYTQTKNLGYKRDNVLCFQRPPHNDEPEVFLSELKNIPGVMNASNMHWSVLNGTDSQSGFSWSGQESEKKIMFKSPRIGYEVVETLGMELLTGRSFSKERQDDNKKIILNETALKLMGLTEPVGRTIGKGSSGKQIIGVVKDFHYGSIHQKVEPMVLRFRNWGPDIMVKIKAGNEMAALDQVKKLFKEFHPEHTFKFSFLDDDYQALYEAEQKVSTLSKYFSLLAIIISCLGLFGLATFTAEQRSKEIGVRKILGASTWSVMSQLSLDFTKLVTAGIFIAMPLGYYIAKNWLDNFAYKIEIQWWFFAGAALTTLFIAWCTVGYQILKAASVNPVESLRNE